MGMLLEMLLFYLPEVFMLVKGLERTAVEHLRQDGGLRAVMTTIDSVVALDSGEGTAWICGKQREAVKQRIDAVVRGDAEPYIQPPQVTTPVGAEEFPSAELEVKPDPNIDQELGGAEEGAEQELMDGMEESLGGGEVFSTPARKRARRMPDP